MKARRIILDRGLDEKDLIFLTDVLEAVWREIEARGLHAGMDRTLARERLAMIILSTTKSGAIQSREEFCEQVKRVFLKQVACFSDAAE